MRELYSINRGWLDLASLAGDFPAGDPGFQGIKSLLRARRRKR